MKPSTSSYFARLLLANLCTALLLGASYDSSKSSSYDMASEQEPSESTVTTEPVAPIIQHALDQAEQANSLQKLLSQKTIGRPGCESCASNIPNIKYKTCSTKNDYLEGQLLTKSYENSILGDLIRKPVNNNDLISPLCIEMSMNYKFGENSKVFRQCSADSANRVAYRPCFSEKYFQLMSNSFNLVSMCMKDHIAKGETEEIGRAHV